MLILFQGENTYESWNALQDTLAEQSHKTIEGDELNDINEIMVNLDSLSLFAEESVPVVLKRFFNNRKKSLRDDFLSILQEKNLRNLRLLMWEDKKIPATWKLWKFFSEKGEIREFHQLKDRTVIVWMEAYIKRLGMNSGSGFLEDIYLRIGNNQGMLAQELEKLSLLLKSEGRKDLQVKDLELVSINADSNIWEFLEAVAGRNRKKILDIFQELLDQGNDVQYIIAMLTRHLKTLFLVKQRVSGVELGELGINPYSFRKASYSGKNFTLPQIKLLFSKLANLDFAIKQGKIEPVLGTNLFLATI